MNIKWEAKEYAENFGFVPQYGRNVFYQMQIAYVD